MKISILSPDAPTIIGDSGVAANILNLTPKEMRLLRLLVLANGAAVSKEVVSSIVGSGEVYRAPMKLRSALSGCRPFVAGKNKADHSSIMTSSSPTTYTFRIEEADEVDLFEVSNSLDEASTALARGNVHLAESFVERWLVSIEKTDLDHAFEDDDLHIWTAEDRDRIRLLRAKAWGLAARVASRRGQHTKVREYVNLVLDPDRGSEEALDALVAECAVKATFVITPTRESALRALNEFFDARDLTYTSDIDEFCYAINDAAGTGYAEFQAAWLERWEGVEPAEIVGLSDATIGRVANTASALSSRHLDASVQLASKPKGALPDILTPGLSPSDLSTELAARFEPDMVTSLLDVSRSAVAAVEAGDFAAQESIARRILELAETEKPLASTGHYFLAEGLRLQADLTTGQARHTLLRLALDAYGTARDLDPENIRASRGLARTFEVLGDHAEAARLFEYSYVVGRQQLSQAERLERSVRLGLNHEVLRAGRHYVHCLEDIRLTDPVHAHVLNASKDRVIELARESSALHRERMPLFKGQQDWSRIEWFMGLTLLAKSYAGVGDAKTALNELANALVARRLMIEGDRPLTAIERANLRWWAATASTVRHELVPGWRAALEALQAALAATDDRAVLSAVDALLASLQPILPPQF